MDGEGAEAPKIEPDAGVPFVGVVLWISDAACLGAETEPDNLKA